MVFKFDRFYNVIKLGKKSGNEEFKKFFFFVNI